MTTAAVAGKPSAGFAHYLRDVIYGALDGVITTLAVVSGTIGANLEPRVGIILGVANLAADGLSMGASNYLGLKSELEQTGRSVAEEMPWRHGLATAAAFAVVGAVPLLGYAIAPSVPLGTLSVAVLLAIVTLAIVGGLRARFVRKALWRSATEIVVVGMFAAGTAYAIGASVERLLR